MGQNSSADWDAVAAKGFPVYFPGENSHNAAVGEATSLMGRLPTIPCDQRLLGLLYSKLQVVSLCPCTDSVQRVVSGVSDKIDVIYELY